ncbi:transglycosylase SLT domain-containing protein [Geomonas sp. Red69]|uniref:Transglycosylase SLT domain-containing protein n=1 Tax=Geomonas diazotrophica TaxID=2843197 RepID=A0ABX8JPJ0_9BACT|nr:MULTISPECIES: transglycosylase SLT domain-containing protein [Geomonas]MBU5636486.1 transglycosylase SLT domain-containing protein [Geomonas diazotrophica]QWV99011.1 transglycosylase SLT domain-containing protein [Geomonas nitrogeniifigens]QXE88177.1 transglycosylase SLT domain-containing protein [Geomonas nitrogeniifigens]
MFCRTIAAAAIVLYATLPASAVNLNKPDVSLSAAAQRMQVKDFRGAREAALSINDPALRSFMAGMAAAKMEQWEEAAAQLPAAAEGYPLLADYALYYQGLALSKLQRHDQALPPLYKLLKEHADSRLARQALILYADTLAAAGYPKEAQQSYATFVERYPSGNDSISAIFGSALCRMKLGDTTAAAAVLRNIYLVYPASPYADKAAIELQNLAAAGIKAEPYSGAELFKRAGTLYDLGRHLKAAEALAEIPLSGESEEFVRKVKFKKGQALYKSKRYQQAQSTFSSLPANAEADLWLARTLDKSGKGDEAFQLFLKLAQDPKGGVVAQEAMLEAAYLKRFQRLWSEAVPLFKKYLVMAPSQKNGNVVWEAAWCSYQARDYQEAAAQFRKLAEREDLRDKALYWLAKTLTLTGDDKGAQAALTALASEFPTGYYALISNQFQAGDALPQPPKNMAELLPLPSGFEREKALITLGLYEEAARELSLSKKGKNPAGIARLYLEMGNYNGAYHTMANEKPRRGDKDSATLLGVTYPLAFRDDVAKNAAAHAVPESLVYAVMRTESNYFPAALSPVGAVGLMQIMPSTAEAMSKGDSKRLTTPDLNIKLGTQHLKDLLELYGRNLTLAVAAYNAGSGNVKRWQKGYGDLPEDEFVESIPFRETREYVKKVVSSMQMYQRLYRLPPFKQPPQQKVAPRENQGSSRQKIAMR